MRILITDFHCASNRGDSAILQGIIVLVRAAFPDAHLTLLTEYPDVARAFFDLPSEQNRLVRLRLRSGKMLVALAYAFGCGIAHRAGIRLPYRDNVWNRFSFSPLFEADLVVSTGGGIYNDFYRDDCARRMISLLFAKLLGKPVAMLCQSFGPFNKMLFRTFSRFCLNRVDLITTRDHRSWEWLQSIRVRARLEITADAAFALHGHPERGRTPPLHRFETLPLPTDTALRVSISVRTWAHYRRHDAERDYLRTLVEVTRWLIEKKRAEVYFVSTCTGFGGYHKDDRIMARDIVGALPAGTVEHARILYNEYSPAELATYYGSMTLHIGTRMHSNILAMLAGTPVVALAYEFKTLELMESLGLSRFGMDVESLSTAEITARIEELLAHRDELAAKIRDGVDRLRHIAFTNEKLLKSVFATHQPHKAPTFDDAAASACAGSNRP
jgi:colanic acid/amylovoran biosynthesis protein